MLEAVVGAVLLAMAVWLAWRVLRRFVRLWVLVAVVAGSLLLSQCHAEVKSFMDGFAGPGGPPGSSSCCGSEVP